MRFRGGLGVRFPGATRRSRGRGFMPGRPGLFFERLYPELGMKTAMIVPT